MFCLFRLLPFSVATEKDTRQLKENRQTLETTRTSSIAMDNVAAVERRKRHLSVIHETVYVIQSVGL